MPEVRELLSDQFVINYRMEQSRATDALRIDRTVDDIAPISVPELLMLLAPVSPEVEVAMASALLLAEVAVALLAIRPVPSLVIVTVPVPSVMGEPRMP